MPETKAEIKAMCPYQFWKTKLSQKGVTYFAVFIVVEPLVAPGEENPTSSKLSSTTFAQFSLLRINSQFYTFFLAYLIFQR